MYPSTIRIGIIGGSGIYEMEGVSQIEELNISTPFGNPSDSYMVGSLGGIPVAFLPRHGHGHILLPSEINYRANLFGFKLLGVTHLVAVTAVGSLQEQISPCDIMIPDQLVDRTCGRASTFFGEGVAAHIPFAEPFCPELSALVYTTAAGISPNVHKGGTLVTIEGPSFSSRAESNLYRNWGMDIIGMTTLQEAKLAREAEICYAAMAMVTDYDCWNGETEAVSVETVVSNLNNNVSIARKIIRQLVGDIPEKRDCCCSDSLKGSIMTRMDAVNNSTRRKLKPLIGKYLDEPSPMDGQKEKIR